MAKITTTYEITCQVKPGPGLALPADAAWETILRRCGTADAAEATARQLALEHRTEVAVERVVRGRDTFRRERIGEARLDGLGRCWFDLTSAGSPLL